LSEPLGTNFYWSLLSLLQDYYLATLFYPQLEPTARGPSEPSPRRLRPTLARVERQKLRDAFSNLSLSPKELFFPGAFEDSSHHSVPLPDSTPNSPEYRSDSSVELRLTPSPESHIDSRPPTDHSDIEEDLPTFHHLPTSTSTPFISSPSSLSPSSSSSPVCTPNSLPTAVAGR